MSQLDPPRESCPPQDMGGDAAKYQYPPPPGEDNEQTKAYNYPAAANSSFIPPTMSYDSQFLQPGGYLRESRVNPQNSYTDAQQSFSDYGRDQLSSPHGFQYISSTRSAPKQRAAIACKYCRKRKIKCFGSGEDAQGRCTNCQRFQQHCVFVPVSGHIRALVPAHLAYPHMQNIGVNSDGGVYSPFPGQQLYSAHRQPLHQIIPTTFDSRSYTATVPLVELSGGHVDEIIRESRKRRRMGPRPSILPPPIPAQLHHGQGSAKWPAAENYLLLHPIASVDI